MSVGGGALQHGPLRAPRRHGEAVAAPPLSEAGRVVEQNAALLQARQYDCQGAPLRRLAAAARQQLLQEAGQYTKAYRDSNLPALDVAAPLILTGHQPHLFHPGVWWKNFALSALGRKLRANPIHLLIDNDTAAPASIRVPRLVGNRLHVETIPLDQPAKMAPYEERPVVDAGLFAAFADRVAQAIKPLVPDPLVAQLWPHAVEASRRGGVLGQCVAEARHCLESQYGLSTLELPFSAVCRTEPFRWFAVHLLAQLPSLHEVHNASLADYRRWNRIRSRTHPVPNLRAEGQWLEAPFWVWTREDPRRRPLFVRRLPKELELTDQGRLSLRLRLSDDGDGGRAVDQLCAGAWRDVKLRPRALVTTMYARLVLSDLFLHGVGGAKYDQLTDLLIQRFFGFEPPEFLTLTATVLLPVELQPAEGADLQRVDRLLRELRYHPERHAPAVDDVDRLRAMKQHWLETLPPRGQRLQRHRGIEAINQALQAFVAPRRERLLSDRRELEAALRNQSLLASREYSFCLFPQETLPPLLLELLVEEP